MIEKLETGIKKEIMDYLKPRNIPANRNQAGKVKVGPHWINLGKSGWPDIICCLPPKGQFLGIEVKKSDGKTSGLQDKIQYEIDQAGGQVIVVRSVEELAIELKRLQEEEEK